MTATGTLRVLLPTDVFPPRCGGAGWSAHALATALLRRGHSLTALVPRRGMHGLQHTAVLGIPTAVRGYHAPGVPFLLNYFRHERLWPILARDLSTLAAADPTDPAGIIHAQHVQVAPAAVLAGARIGWPVVVTVRDHWPWDYFATGLHGDRLPLAAQNWATLATDLPARLGPLRGAAALAAIPYMLAHMRRRQAFLRCADAVVAGSEYMARRLRQIVDPARVTVIPNMVDMAAIDQAIARSTSIDGIDARFLLYVGKLEHNKGAQHLPMIMRELMRQSGRASAELPMLVVAGDGPLREPVECELTQLGVRTRFLDWIEHDDVLRLMARCEILLYPSGWGEPLTRVLLEACASGAACVAMPTGGTPDIIIDGVSGLLAPSPPGMARHVRALLDHGEQRRFIAAAARERMSRYFSTQAVVGRVEDLYRSLAWR